ncbi:MAG: succinate dehydrogenase, hydrophobic membrane anchor protein [Gammaproteobacteria bacterium]|nr:succinate dehydrogenase, hydrophobic membrane anchor protein [Gammaproteobacteria bacterium]MCH2668255.1 succinate dehydrogenase, hydrophobic membrane anchor protein [Gammaproteobacteria bacterium]|tara:strand:+ start:657 stop:1043 length:387 start_codon:yes stop_codon:yes gene_type:complete
MSLVSPLNKVIGLGSAKEGAEHWWMQRLSAVALIPLGLWFSVALGAMDQLDYSSVVEFVRHPVNSILLILTLITMTYHSQLGVQVVVEDYVHSSSLKIITIVAVSFAHILVAVTGVFAILKVALGAAI